MTNELEPSSLTGKTAKGAAWIMGSRLIMRMLGFVNTIILARLLVPADFGLVAIALTAMQLLQGFSDIGVSQAVIKFHDADRDDLDTLFTFSALRGFLIGGLLIVAAPFIAKFYGDPRMLGVFLGISIYPIVTGLVNPRFFEFERALDYSREFISSAVNKLAGVVVSIVIAVVFRSYWAIILGMVTGGVVQLIISYAMRPHLPRFTFKSKEKVFGFSGWLAGVSFMAALNNKIDTFILARFTGVTATGNFYVGLQLAELASAEIAAPLARVIYPSLSSLQGNADRMRIAFLKGVSALGVVALPAALGFSFVAHDLVQILLGPKWIDAIPVVQILAPVIGLQALFTATQYFAMALGLTRLVFFRELIFFFVRFPIFIWATITYGLMGAVWAVAALGLFHVALNLALYARATGHPFWEPLASARNALGGAVAMAAYFLLIRDHWAIADAAPILRLVGDVAIGGGVYCLAYWGLWRAAGRPKGIEEDVIGYAQSLLARVLPR